MGQTHTPTHHRCAYHRCVAGRLDCTALQPSPTTLTRSEPYSPNVLERLYEKSSKAGQPPHHEANHGSIYQRFPARTKSLVIFAHPPVLVDPSDRPLHHPPTR